MKFLIFYYNCIRLKQNLRTNVFKIKNVLPVRYIFLFLIIIIPAILKAQLTAPGSRAVRYTSYPSAPGVKDPVFIYCKVTGNEKGSLQAVSPGGTGPFSFTWYRWSDATKSFSILIKPESGTFISSLTGLDEGGYRVHITDGTGYIKDLTAWIFLDKPTASAKLQNFTCDYVKLNGEGTSIDIFYYKNPINGDSIKLRNGYTFLWSSNPASAIPFPSLELNPVTYIPPLEDVTYRLQVVDSFSCNTESSFFYTSIHVKADFEVDPDKGEAPLEVTFTDKSIRGSIYKWEFGDHSKDSISSLKNPEPHIYFKPGEYLVKLTIESDKGCVDSLRFDKIVVDPSKLSIPNVFTPNGDNINDYFIVEAVSLRRLYVQVFSRSGMKVFDFTGEGETLRNWKGWDGNINDSSAKASPGIYYYIIQAIGWDDVVYNSKEYRGFLHLYR
jgi:gliding motility-associated-like protein